MVNTKKNPEQGQRAGSIPPALKQHERRKI